MKLSRQRLMRLGVMSSKISYKDFLKSVQSANLVAYWPLDDTSGTAAVNYQGVVARNGVYNGGFTLGNLTEPSGHKPSVLLGGVAGTYITPYSTSMRDSLGFVREFSFVICFNASAVGNWTSGSVQVLGQFYGATGDVNNNVQVYKSATNYRLTIAYKAAGVTSQINISTIGMTGWVQVGVSASLSGNAMKVYINGKQTGLTQTGLGTFAVQLASYTTLLGAQSVSGGVWNGNLAHAAIWNSALTDAQFLSLATPLNLVYPSHADTLTAITTATEQAGSDVLDGLIYTVGGIRGTELNEVYAYNPTSNTWATKAVLPIAVQSPVVRTVGGKLYCIGGLKTSIGVYQDTYEYDPVGDSWTKKANMPTAREDMGSAVVGTKIYVFGGLGPPSTPCKKLEIYDTTTDQWTSGADMPDFKHLGDFGASYNGMVYAMGATNSFVGYPSITPTATSYKYNPATNTWSQIANHPAPRCYSELVTIGEKIYQISGASTSTTTYVDTIYAYTPSTDSWELVGHGPLAARGTALAVLNNIIYMSGGFTGAALTNFYKIL